MEGSMASSIPTDGDILFNFNASCKDHIKDPLNKELNRNSNLQARKVVLLAFCVFILQADFR